MSKNENLKPQLTRCKKIITGIPGQKAIDNHGIIHDGKTILEIGPYATLKKEHAGRITDLGQVTIVPGLINAHCHLNLSKLRDKTLAGQGFVPWLLSMIAHDYKDTDFDAVKKAVIEARDLGTCCFGDILKPQDTQIADILTELKVYHTCFCEAFGFLPIENSLAGPIPYKKTKYGVIAGSGHALHTTSPEVIQEIKAQDRKKSLPFSIHLSEHGDETGMLMGEKTGFYKLLEESKMLGRGYSPPMKTPVEYARDLKILDRTTLAVHCVTVSDTDIKILAKTKTNICLCPRSNAFIGVGRAPWEKILEAGINVSLGTDSIASNHDLNLWNELSYFLKGINLDLSMEEAMGLITHNPAKALLMDDQLGTLEKGKPWQFAVMPEEVAALFKSKKH